MDITKALQCFEQAINGDLGFVYTGVVFRKDGAMFRAKSRNRTVDPQSCDAELEDIERSTPEAYCPIPPFGCTIAPEPSDWYIKHTNPVSFGASLNLLASRVIQDITTCEVIRKHPHPNLSSRHTTAVWSLMDESQAYALRSTRRLLWIRLIQATLTRLPSFCRKTGLSYGRRQRVTFAMLKKVSGSFIA